MYVIMFSAVMLNVIVLSVISMLCFIVPSVIMLSVVMLSDVAPLQLPSFHLTSCQYHKTFFKFISKLECLSLTN
jgi:hypothetical protein